MSLEEDAAAGATATRGPRLSMEALSFLEANERELTMHPITLTFRSSGAALLAVPQNFFVLGVRVLWATLHAQCPAIGQPAPAWH